MPKYCTSCGSALSESDTFCSKCGASVINTSIPSNKGSIININIINNKKVLISIVSVAVIIIGIVLFIALSNPLKGDWKLYMKTKSSYQMEEDEIWSFDGTKLIQRSGDGRILDEYFYEQTDDKLFFSTNQANVRQDYYTIEKITSSEMTLGSSDGRRRYFLKKL